MSEQPVADAAKFVVSEKARAWATVSLEAPDVLGVMSASQYEILFRAYGDVPVVDYFAEVERARDRVQGLRLWHAYRTASAN